MKSSDILLEKEPDRGVREIETKCLDCKGIGYFLDDKGEYTIECESCHGVGES